MIAHTQANSIYLAYLAGVVCGAGIMAVLSLWRNRKDVATARLTFTTDYGEIRVFPDGNQWCALRGPDLQVGQSYFADTPYEAFNGLLKLLKI